MPNKQGDTGGQNQSPNPGAIWWGLAAGIAAVLYLLVTTPPTSRLDYSEFKQVLQAGKVREATLGDSVINGELAREGLERLLPQQRREQLACTADTCTFAVNRVEDPGLVAELEAQGVRFSGERGPGVLAGLLPWLLPLVLLVWLWRGIGRAAGLGGGMFDFARSRARLYEASKTGVKFTDVAGIDEAKDELMEVVGFLKDPERYRRLGGKIPKGVLIVGAPGTGKTLLAKAVAGEACVPFFSMSGSEFVEMFVGVGAARVRDLFAQATEKAPCIIFIDELDALGKARSVAGYVGGNQEQEQTLNQLLVEMDGFDSNKGVILLAATNRPEILDPALLRPGRFDRHIALDRPDLKGREKILAVHARQVQLGPGVDLGAIAARTAGFVGADLANLVNEAALLAARRGKDAVETSDVDEAIDRVVAGLEKKTRVMNRQEKETVAYHEAGHALIAETRPHTDRVAKISIIPRGFGALGYTQQLPTEDRYLLKKAELLERLDVLLGGRVAEELVFGDVSTGVHNDLQQATDLARHMVAQYGMSERLGLATFEAATGTLNPGRAREQAACSEATARVIDTEIARLLAEARSRVLATLTEKRALLDALAHALLERETLDRAALQVLLEQHAQRQRIRA